MIEFRAGDLLKSAEDDIGQGVAEGNQEGLGAGLAFKISQQWPAVQAEFKRFARRGWFKGGMIWGCPPSEARPGVVYLATQPNTYYATVPFLRKALRQLAMWVERENIASVGLPKIGAGLGKLSWRDEVKPMLADHLTNFQFKFVVYEDLKIGDRG